MFQCQSCEKQFTQEEQLKGHEWEHASSGAATSPEQKVYNKLLKKYINPVIILRIWVIYKSLYM
jgi:hypothetical protein